MATLFESAKIGHLTLRNRIVMPPMYTAFAQEGGSVSERLIRYYSDRAKGGVGLIMVEVTCIDAPVGKLRAIQLCIDDDKFVPGLTDLVNSVHMHGARVGIQIHHAGRQTNLAATGGLQPVSASDVPVKAIGLKPRPLALDEIEDVVEKFGEGARRAKDAGFDLVEVHGAHGYLIQQFLSPYTNRRGDEYGGSFENRMRMALEVLDEVRRKVGEDYPVTYRLSGSEFIEGGLALEDTKKIAKVLEDRGVDGLHLSSGMADGRPEGTSSQPMCTPRGCFVPFAEGVKQVVNVPVITVGRINDPRLAEEVVASGKADFVAMGRALIADPELPLKAQKGRFEDVRMCIACGECNMRIGRNLSIACAVNPMVGREGEEVKPASKPRRVLVIGGGVAGMEAALVSASRGHKVTLCEKGSALGGQLLLAVVPPHKEELRNVMNYYENQLPKLGVEVYTGREMSVEEVDAMKPDAVVLATGAEPLIPDIPGIKGSKVVTAQEVLQGRKVGKKVIIAGGGMVGCEIGELLAEKGVDVTITEMMKDVATDMYPPGKAMLIDRLKGLGVKILVNTEIVEVVEEGVMGEHEGGGERRLVKGDTVVLALGWKARADFAHALRDRGYEVHVAGDAREQGKIIGAVHDGFRVATLL